MPLVSVIIPTHNRARYAIPTIRSVLAVSSDIEVVVCDTSEIDLISPEFSDYSDMQRLRLIRPNRPMSVVDNFNEAMLAATGQYLLFIGDDDFVSHAVVDVAQWAMQQEVDSIKFSFPILYFWPDFEHRSKGGEYGGTLRILPFTGLVTMHDAQKALRDAMYNFGGGVLEMPRAYAGMISRKLADKICTRYGALFGGVSPDIYSAALISLESERCVKIDFPVIVPGASGASTAGQSAQGKHVGGLRDNDHIGAFKDLKWDERIPEFYSVPTVWSYSLLKAVETAHLDIKKVNFPRLYVKCLIFQRAFKEFTLITLKEYTNFKNWYQVGLELLVAGLEEAIWIVGKLRDRFKERYISRECIVKNNLVDSLAAKLILETYLEKINVPLKLSFKRK